MQFSDFIGHDAAKLSLILNAVDPRCGGVLFVGEKGSGKSTLARLYPCLVPEGTAFVNVPLNATEEALWGCLALEETLKTGRKIRETGLLQRAGGGALYIDDLNLLSAEVTALIFKAQDLGETSSRFRVLASMNPEEGGVSPHILDRFGMCVVWEGLKDPVQRIAVMRRESGFGNGNGRAVTSGEVSDRNLRGKIDAVRESVDAVDVPPEVRGRMATLCLDQFIAGHRGDVFLFHAARAYAAFCGEREVTTEHVQKVLPLVLTHRRRLLQNPEADQPEDPQPRDDHQEQANQQGNNPQDLPEPMPDRSEGADGNDLGDSMGDRMRETQTKEDVFNLGEIFKVRRIVFRKDRRNRSVSGRRTKTKSAAKRGRYVKSLVRPNSDIAVDATLRAAAPYQAARGRTDRVLIHDADLRFKQREKKMGHLVVFVVDGSGSMGARQRMVETKGAIQSLLTDCYEKRERVALIVFRKDRAEVVLQPTSSVEAASKRLKDIPVGGKTPLTAGLMETWRLVRSMTLRSPQIRFLIVLVTDGRANRSLSEMPIRDEIQRMTALLHDLNATDYIVIDTEEKGGFMTTDRAKQIASGLNADYYTIDSLKAEYLTEIVRKEKSDYGLT
jgi:magnesium chelatase subunit D